LRPDGIELPARCPTAATNLLSLAVKPGVVMLETGAIIRFGFSAERGCGFGLQWHAADGGVRFGVVLGTLCSREGKVMAFKVQPCYRHEELAQHAGANALVRSLLSKPRLERCFLRQLNELVLTLPEAASGIVVPPGQVDHEIFVCAPSSVPWAAGLVAADRVWQTETALTAPGHLQAIKGVGLWAARAGVAEHLLPPGQQDRASAQLAIRRSFVRKMSLKKYESKLSTVELEIAEYGHRNWLSLDVAGLCEVSNIASYTVSYPFSDITEVIKTIGFEGGSNPRLIGGEVERTFWRLVYNDACEIRCTAL